MALCELGMVLSDEASVSSTMLEKEIDLTGKSLPPNDHGGHEAYRGKYMHQPSKRCHRQGPCEE